MAKLGDLARLIRSKNAGAFMLTFEAKTSPLHRAALKQANDNRMKTWPRLATDLRTRGWS